MLFCFSQANNEAPQTHIQLEVIDILGSSTYFDGVVEGTPHIGGDWGVLYISHDHSIKFSACIGHSTNNQAEMMDLKLLVQLVVEHGIQNVQMMEDSHLVIDWMRLKKIPKEHLTQAFVWGANFYCFHNPSDYILHIIGNEINW